MLPGSGRPARLAHVGHRRKTPGFSYAKPRATCLQIATTKHLRRLCPRSGKRRRARMEFVAVAGQQQSLHTVIIDENFCRIEIASFA